MKLTSIVLLFTTLLTSCATGYGALAGGGALASVGLLQAVSVKADNPGTFVAQGFALGVLAGAIGGAIAGAIVRGHEHRKQEQLRADLRREREARQRDSDEQALQLRVQRLEAERWSPARAPASEPPNSAAKDATAAARNGHETKSLELSPHVREFSAD